MLLEIMKCLFAMCGIAIALIFLIALVGLIADVASGNLIVDKQTADISEQEKEQRQEHIDMKG